MSSILCLITFAGMQLFKTQLGSGKMMTIFGGFLGSQVFVFALTVSFSIITIEVQGNHESAQYMKKLNI